MTLVVDYPGFIEAVKRYCAGKDDCIFYKKVGDSLHLSYVNAGSGVQIISSTSAGSIDEARAEVVKAGFCLNKGTWVTEASIEHLAQLATEVYVAAVSYETRKGPGLWMDAYSAPPTEGSVLRSIFEEFVSEGIMEDGDFEQFIHEARPNVRILDPADVERFIKQKSG